MYMTSLGAGNRLTYKQKCQNSYIGKRIHTDFIHTFLRSRKNTWKCSQSFTSVFRVTSNSILFSVTLSFLFFLYYYHLSLVYNENGLLLQWGGTHLAMESVQNYDSFLGPIIQKKPIKIIPNRLRTKKT